MAIPIVEDAWRAELPALVGRSVVLREPNAADLDALVALLSLGDATRFGIDDVPVEAVVQEFIERAVRDRKGGVAFAYVVTLSASGTVVGLAQVRQLDQAFATAEWECTLAPSYRGSGIFVEAAQLLGSFTFKSVRARRLEARVLLRNGRANGAMRKLGAVQEGILRRSVRHGGEYLDQVMWSMLAEDWDELWTSPTPGVH